MLCTLLSKPIPIFGIGFHLLFVLYAIPKNRFYIYIYIYIYICLNIVLTFDSKVHKIYHNIFIPLFGLDTIYNIIRSCNTFYWFYLNESNTYLGNAFDDFCIWFCWNKYLNWYWCSINICSICNTEKLVLHIYKFECCAYIWLWCAHAIQKYIHTLIWF